MMALSMRVNREGKRGKGKGEKGEKGRERERKGGVLRDVANSSYGKNFAHAFLNDGIVSMRVNREGKKRERERAKN